MKAQEVEVVGEMAEAVVEGVVEMVITVARVVVMMAEEGGKEEEKEATAAVVVGNPMEGEEGPLVEGGAQSGCLMGVAEYCSCYAQTNPSHF